MLEKKVKLELEEFMNYVHGEDALTDFLCKKWDLRCATTEDDDRHVNGQDADEHVGIDNDKEFVGRHPTN